MSISSLPLEHETTWHSRVMDYVELTKPRIAVLILVTVAASGYVASWGNPDPWMLLHAMIGVALVAGSASALNHWQERDRDLRMPRTANRPIPTGRISTRSVLLFAASTLLVGLAYLGLTTNLTTVALGFASWIAYAWVYTPLKPRTTANTAIGAISGALPTSIGWAACGGEWDARAMSLFLILFLWQFPHFMAIAWLYRKQYAEAGFQMLTVADPSGRRAGVQAVLSALALLPVSFVPALVAPDAYGSTYVAIAFALGVFQLTFAIRFWLATDDRTARALLRVTLIYLPLLMGLLVASPFV